MIRLCGAREFDAIWEIINDGSQAYRGVIPADRWPSAGLQPYMTREKLKQEIGSGVIFWGYEENGALLGVMGIQKVLDVTLIRHAYVKTTSQQRGLGASMLAHLRTLTADPVLIGTWAAADWAIRFYKKHGFEVVEPEEKSLLLRKYWSVPERQIETSVVLADQQWRTREQPRG